MYTKSEKPFYNVCLNSMAHFTAQLFRDRIAAYASNSGGIVNCPRTTSCRFEASGTSFAQLRTRAGYCTCNGPKSPTKSSTSSTPTLRRISESVRPTFRRSSRGMLAWVILEG